MKTLLQSTNGEEGMWIYKFIQERLTYLRDSLSIEKLNIKIESFQCAGDEIEVVYRIGRQRLSQTKLISVFSSRYYDHISNYDKQRLAKFSTLNILLKTVFTSQSESSKLINYINEEIKNEQLF